MKTFMNNLGSLVIVILAIVFCLNVYSTNAEERYRCFAELYPEKAKRAQIHALGEIAIINGNKYRIMAEAKDPELDQWVQWLDVEPIDGVCDYAVSFKLAKNGDISFKVWDCEYITETIKEYCVREGRNLNDMKHFADKQVDI